MRQGVSLRKFSNESEYKHAHTYIHGRIEWGGEALRRRVRSRDGGGKAELTSSLIPSATKPTTPSALLVKPVCKNRLRKYFVEEIDPVSTSDMAIVFMCESHIRTITISTLLVNLSVWGGLVSVQLSTPCSGVIILL